MTLRSTQSFVLVSSIKWDPKLSRKSLIQSKLSPWSGSVEPYVESNHNFLHFLFLDALFWSSFSDKFGKYQSGKCESSVGKKVDNFFEELRNFFPIFISILLKLKTLYDPFFMDGVQLSQGCRTTRKRQFTFYHWSPEVLGSHLINPRWMKCWVELGATQWFRT